MSVIRFWELLLKKDWKMQSRKRIKDQKNTLQRLWHI